MEEAVRSLVDAGSLQHVRTTVETHNADAQRPLRRAPDDFPIFTESVEIYTAPTTPLAPRESSLGKFRDNIRKDNFGYGSWGSSGWGRRLVDVSIEQSEELGKLSVRQQTKTKTTVSVTKGAVESTLQPVDYTHEQSGEESRDVRLLGQTTIRIFPSVRQAELTYKNDKGEMPDKDYYKEMGRARRHEFIERAKRRIGISPKEQ